MYVRNCRAQGLLHLTLLAALASQYLRCHLGACITVLCPLPRMHRSLLPLIFTARGKPAHRPLTLSCWAQARFSRHHPPLCASREEKQRGLQQQAPRVSALCGNASSAMATALLVNALDGNACSSPRPRDAAATRQCRAPRRRLAARCTARKHTAGTPPRR